MSQMSKHQYGSGTVYLRGEVWWFSYWVNGRKIQRSSGSHDEAEAKRQLKIAIGEAAAGINPAPQKATIDDLFTLVVADHELRQLRSLAHVKWLYGAHIKDSLGPLLAYRFNQKTVREHINKRRAEGAADASINKELAIVRRGFKLGTIEDPPLVRSMPYIPTLALDNARQGFIEEPDYIVIRMALPDHLKCLFVVAYHTGMRLGELRRLRWDQVDLANGEIRLEKRQTKGKRPRTVPIYGDMQEWLEAQPRDGSLVFQYGRRPIGSHVRGWREACASVGFPDLHVHDLRRSAVRNMERAGVPRHISMAIVGHKTESMFRRYDIVTPKDMREAAEKMNRYKNRYSALKLVNDK
jgi:integrase